MKLGIIAAAGALERIRPAMVEDIFALAVVLQIADQRPEKLSLGVFHQQMLAEPAGLGGGRT
ncbi:hypothetical protein D3C80_1955740 [compost metagenome]